MILKKKKFHVTLKVFERFFKIKNNSNYLIYNDISKLPLNHTIETLVENLSIKKNILSKLEYDFDKKLLFTNTSSYAPKEINKNAYGLHFFNPICHLKIIETTCAESIFEKRFNYLFLKLKELNFKLIFVKNNRGYIYNYILFNKIASYYELIEKYGYNKSEIEEVLNFFDEKNNFDEVTDIVGAELTKNIIKNLFNKN